MRYATFGYALLVANARKSWSPVGGCDTMCVIE